MEKHPLHIKNPELQKSPEVDRAVERQERHEDEKIPNDPSERIEAYMDRLENIFLNPDERVRKRNVEMFRDKIYDALIIKRANFPESYFELQKRIAREQGHGDIQISDEMRERMIDTAIEDQKRSLDAWIDYFASNDAVYPQWFKYYAWNQITKLSQFDKERGEFKKRTDSTVAPFPDIYREPLAQIADLYERVKDDNKDSEARRGFDKKFPSLYAELIQKSLAAQIERKEEIQGQWVKYEQGKERESERLFQSLEGKGTGWCTAGRSTAETQIESGDFYVYYTNDTSGNPSQPRLAIRMEGNNRIGEVRGILPHQNVEPIMQKVLDDKLSTFGENAEIYRKKSADMARLTAIDNSKDTQISNDDLLWLFSGKIEGFGYDKDPRIDELQKRYGTAGTALVLIRNGNQEMILGNLGKFKGLTSEVATELIKHDEVRALQAIGPNLSSFEKLTPNIATMLIERGYIKVFEYSTSRFEGLTAEIASKLSEHGVKWAQFGARNFEGLTAGIAMKAIEHGDGWGVLENLDKFEGLKADTALATKLIEHGAASAVMKYLEKFEGLNVDTALAMKIIEHGKKRTGPGSPPNVDAVVENIEKFEGLKADAALAIKLIENGGAWAVSKRIASFKGLKADAALAMKMIESGMSGDNAVTSHIEEFQGLTTEVAMKLAETQYGSYIFNNLEKFEGLKMDSALAMKFIKSGNVYDVATHLEMFDELNNEVMNALIEKGQQKYVQKYHDRFRP